MNHTPSEPIHADEALRAFLADRDIHCPDCNYNLRGVEQRVCPECGHGIALTIARPGRSRGYLMFVLLALGWVLTAATMNGVRIWNTVRQEASTRQWVSFSQTFGSTVAPGVIVPRITSGQATIPSPITSNRSSVTFSGGSFSFNSSTTFPAIAAKPGYNWSNVSQRSWIMLGWWTGLALLSLLWVIITLIRRGRFSADHPPRPLVAWACTLFALYAGYHAIMFTREFI